MPTALILPLLEDKFPKGVSTDKVFGKVEGYLEDYAESLDATPRRLMVKDVYDQTGEIHPKLLRYIDNIPRLPKQTVKRWKNYQSEIRSNLRNLSKKLYGVESKKEHEHAKNNLLLKRVPEAMQVVLPHLQRVGRPKFTEEDKRLKAPLKESGAIILSALLNIWERHKLTSCEELFIHHSADLAKELKTISPSPCINYLKGFTKKIRLRLGFRKPVIESESLEVDKWPPTLQREWRIYERKAKQKPSPALVIEAKEGKFSAKKIGQVCIDDYRLCIGYALSAIKPEEDLSILDLIKVVPRENLNPEGSVSKEHNPLVDLYRESERAKKGRRKGEGYDSACFDHFLAAVKGVASRNGHGSHIKKFNEAYRVSINNEAKEDHKQAKKDGLPITWVDGQIYKLNVRVQQIIKTGSFKRTPGRVRKSRRDLLLVMFFVWLVTLRYMGYRQQCMVRCKVGENFILNPDGSITLRFNKTKNGKRIRMDLNEKRRLSHGLLWDTLTLYYKKVYPYIVKESRNTLGGHLFVVPSTGLSFRPFKDHTDFHNQFVRCRDIFMDVDGLGPEARHSLHPHFLRGLCTDWMVIILKMTCEQAAEVLGILPSVLEREYLQQDREHDAGPMFDIVNARLSAEQSGGELKARIDDVLERVDKTQEKIITEKDRQIEALQAELASLKARLKDSFS